MKSPSSKLGGSSPLTAASDTPGTAVEVASFCVICNSEPSSESFSSIAEVSPSERMEVGGGSNCSERCFFPWPPGGGEPVARLVFLSFLGLGAKVAVGTRESFSCSSFES
ncbi:hypothetical protein TNCT_477051 [Trichonephila clavata]|uniref:Uncharacterized protein n=1 Tax=Trichonephila clavata TaxID=2740835 RepID=A0A8X6M4V5_TRICU|nr:hypothetical protein TNCT_477051 [Trichonephila clavata]